MNVFTYAKQMERDGEAYYRELADKCRQKGLKQILLRLAEDEVKHYRIIEKMENQQQVELPETAILSEAKTLFQQMREEDTINLDVAAVDLYEKALENEVKSRDFYRRKADDTDDPAAADVLTRLADEEDRHRHLIENIIRFLSKPDRWLEDAEWHHLEEF